MVLKLCSTCFLQEPVDVETVEEIKQNLAIVKMWESVKGDVKQEFR